MPATLLDLYYARNADSTLRKRVESAILLAAFDVTVEAGATANHAERLAWATGVASDPAKLAQAVDRVTIRCIQNTTIQANPDLATDNDIRFVTNGSINALAGVAGAV